MRACHSSTVTVKVCGRPCHPMDLGLDHHLTIDMGNDLLDSVIEKCERLVALLRRYMVSPGL